MDEHDCVTRALLLIREDDAVELNFLAAGADVVVPGIRKETSKGTIAVRLGFMMVLLPTRA